MALLAVPAIAQVDAPPATSVDEVVVTGSRIRLRDFTAPNPVVSVTAAQIESSGQTNLTDYLVNVPALTASMTLADGADTSTPGLAGMNLLDLRNLGTVRTLVLVDGRRHVSSSPGSAAVDINTIPAALVERVDILTGGASAVYGADGVSGVVNFILKKDFEGVDIRAQTGVTDEGGGANQLVSIVLGQNFHDRRGNVTLGYEYAHDDKVTLFDRSYTRPGRRQIMIANPDDEGSFSGPEYNNPNLYNNILATDVRYIDTARAGAVYTNFDTATSTAGVSFLGDGRPWVDGIWDGSFVMIGGSGSRLDDYNDDLLPGLERHAFTASGSYKLTDRARLFGDVKYTRSETEFEAQPSYDYGLYLSMENPYMPDSIRADAMAPGGLGTIYDGVLMGRDNFDLGKTRYDVTRETIRAVAGIEGALTDAINYELSYVYGRAEESQLASNVRINERFFAATDVVLDPATGQAVCRSNLNPNELPEGDWFAQFAFDPDTWGWTFTPGAGSGCIPFNVFGEASPADAAAAAAWINTTAEGKAVIDQHVVNAFITGDTSAFLNLPAGPLGFALGGEYRRESSDSIPSQISALADLLESPISTAGRGSRTKGSFDVKEVFVEVTVPVLRDVQFAQELTVGGAYRYSDYSISGGSDTWNFNAQWRPVNDLMFRGTVAQAVRAPNINNYFAGRTQTFAELADPCSQGNLGQGEAPATRQANCTAALTALGVDPAGYNDTSSESIGGFITGNLDLKPETADTYTLGFVLTPSAVPGLSIALDYYNVEITDAIQSYSAQTIVDNCYDLPQPNQFCDLVTRNPGDATSPGRISDFRQVPGNIASYETAGYDLTVSYALDPANFGVERDIGTFDIRLVANKLETLRTVEASGAPTIDRLGRRSAPEWQGTLDIGWNYRGVRANYGYNYFEETLRFAPINLEKADFADPRYHYYNAKSTHDIQVAFDVNEGFSAYVGVNNIGDQKPEFSAYDYPVSPQGRYFYAGIKASLGSIGSLVNWR